MQKGEIWMTSLPDIFDHVQSGTRPVILMKGVEGNVLTMVPCTSNLNVLRYPHTISIDNLEYNGLSQESIALVFQLGSVDRRRLLFKIGNLDRSYQQAINGMIREMLHL